MGLCAFFRRGKCSFPSSADRMLNGFRRVLTVNEALKERLLETPLERLFDASNVIKSALYQAPFSVNATPFSSAHNLGYYPISHGYQRILSANQGKRKRNDEAEDPSDVPEVGSISF
jgi:hypothetical protein